MSRRVKISSPPLSQLVVLFIAVPSISQGDEPFIQADIYNTLYEAHVQCDNDLDLSRSEFITEMFERYRGNRVSMELLRKLIAHFVQVAKPPIADKTKERELYISQILDAPKESFQEDVEQDEACKERHKKIREIDDFLKGKRQYVEVQECVLKVLQEAPQ